MPSYSFSMASLSVNAKNFACGAPVNTFGVPQFRLYPWPVPTSVGVAVSVAAVACTRNIGRIFVDHFESGATLQDIAVPKR